MNNERTRAERETLINPDANTTLRYNEDPDDMGVVWTASPAMIRRMEKLGVEPYRVDAPDSKYYHVPRSWIIVRPPKKMTLTDEQRKAIGDRLRKK